MLGIEGAARQGRRRDLIRFGCRKGSEAGGPVLTLTLRIELLKSRQAPPAKRNRRLRRAQGLCSELPRFGMCTKAEDPVRSTSGWHRAIEIRAPVVAGDLGGMQLVRVFSASPRGLAKMDSLIVPRRQFLRGLASLAICAPAVVRASNLMGISARFGASYAAPPSAAAQDALALLQHEMERRFAETLFGAENLSADENSVLTRSPLVAEANITALWELRTLFGPRGAPPKPLEDLPAEVRADLFSMLGACPDAGSEPWAARLSSFAAQENGLRSI